MVGKKERLELVVKNELEDVEGRCKWGRKERHISKGDAGVPEVGIGPSTIKKKQHDRRLYYENQGDRSSHQSKMA